MKIKKIVLTNFKRFTHLTVGEIPQTAKLVVLVGPNGSGKTSLMEAMNHYYKYLGYGNVGDYHYLSKTSSLKKYNGEGWWGKASKMVDIKFHDAPDIENNGRNNIQGCFYFRTAYRNESDFQINAMYRQEDPTKSIRLNTLIENDTTVSANYQRLVSNSVSGLFDKANDKKAVEELREELTGKIRIAVERVFEDLKFPSLGDPLVNGNFYFTKGTVENFYYRNLSAGEKSAFDLILDIVVQGKYYPDAIYCIDEPESHMHTRLQGKVLRELYLLVPGTSQLWISTHSIGMLKEAEEIESENPGTVVFLDFSERDFDGIETIRPSRIGKTMMDKFYELAFGDFAKLMLPKKIVFCEGDPKGKHRKNFDKTIYEIIFGDTHSDTSFISGGSSNELKNIKSELGDIMSNLLRNVEVIKLIDRDDHSDKEVSELNENGIKLLKKRHLESYLLDDSIIKKLCETKEKPEKYEECLAKKREAIEESVTRGNPKDDIKSASGDIYKALIQTLGLTQCGNKTDTFLRDTIAPLITEETCIYKQLEKEIFD